MKKLLIAAFVIIAIVAGVLALRRPAGEPAAENRIIKEDHAAERYMLDIEYPEIVSLADRRAKKDINERLQAIIDGQRAEFLKQVAETVEFFDGSGEPPEGMSSGLWVDYMLPMFSNRFVSVAFTISNYAAGAAHPNNYTIVFNYDVASRAPIELADLFIPESDYLGLVSGLAIADLRRQLGGPEPMGNDDWITEGAAPAAEHYRNFVLDGERGGLVILFDPYQVAPYAAGVREVVLSSDALSGALTPDALSLFAE